VQAEVLYQRGALPQATYLFKHALIQEAAYQSLLRSTRLQYHQQIAQVIAERFPATAATQPELLAHHCTEAGLAEQAVEYWQRAGERSNTQSAYVEAVAHLTKGLDVLQTLPDSPARVPRELTMQLALERALQMIKGLGAPERGQVLARVYELCRQVGDTPQLVTVLGGLASWHRERGEIHMAQEVAEQRLTLAQRQSDVTLFMQAHRGLGGELFFGGAFAPAYDHLTQAIALATRQQDSPRAGSVNVPFFMEGCQVMLGRILWMLGYPDQALTQFHQALALVQKLAHPGQLATILVLTAWHHWKRREPAAAQTPAEAALALATEQGFGQWIGQAMLVRGWALAAQGRGTEGLAELRQGLAHREAIGAVVGRAMDPILLAETYGRAGQVEEGLRVLAEMRVAVDNSGLCFLEAEMYRLTGELLLQQAVPNEPQAEACFQQALNVARRQQAKSWELRTAMSLSRLWQRQGKRDEARRLLAPIYGWFTEGFDTADLQEAKALLDELS
jgi:predicted ATPase